ncbi:unnamed protein product [Heterobilharzia americana]|nr:unnamed protein product [Heterobilharzia americana]
MALVVDKIRPGQSTSTSSDQQKVQRVGSLVELFDFFLLNDGKDIDTLTVNSFLYTYRLFSDVEVVLEVIDKKFWNICHSSCLSTSYRAGVISSFQYMFHAWLQQPHLKDFDSPQKVIYLKRLIRIIANWFDIFQPFYQNSQAHMLREFMKCCGGNLPPSKNKRVTRIMLCDIDSEIWDQLATDMEILCRQAVNCLKIFACKYNIDLNPEREFLPPHTISVNKDYRHYSPHDNSKLNSKTHSNQSVIIQPLINPLINLWNLNVDTVAEQLTIVDQRLFLSIELNDCLIYARGKPASSVQATIDQYNKLYQFVQSSVFNSDQDYPILVEPTPIYSKRFNRQRICDAPVTRASPQVITIWSKDSGYSPNYRSSTSDIGKLKTGCIITWINIAYRLGQTRNYSALKAVIMALQSTPILRLWHSWNVLEYHYHEHFLKFKHLASIVSFDNNQEQLRKRLNKCAKKMYWYLKLNNPNPICGGVNKPGHIPQYEIISEEGDNRNTENLSILNHSSYLKGVIPYLGVFLSDLTLLHHSSPDYVSRSKYLSNKGKAGNYINSNSDNISSLVSSPNNDISSIQTERNQDNRLLSVPQQLFNFAQSTPNLLSPQPYNNVNNNTKQSFNLLKNTSPSIIFSSPTTSVSSDHNCSLQSNVNVKKVLHNLSRRHSTTDNGDDKLINLDKHRREFKILANLFLLQQNAQLYALKSEPDFDLWFQSYPLITESEALNRSCDMEPDDEKPQQLTRPFSASPYSFGVNSSTNIVDSRKPRYILNSRVERSKYAITRPPSAVSTTNTTSLISPMIGIVGNANGDKTNKLRNSSSHSTSDLLNKTKDDEAISTSAEFAKISDYKWTPNESPSTNRDSFIHLHVAYLSGRSHSSNHLHSKQALSSVELTVSATDSVSDVLSRALKLFSRADQNVDHYDLIQVQRDGRDIALQKNINFYQSIHYSASHSSNNKYHNPFEFICTPVIHNINRHLGGNNSTPNSPSNMNNNNVNKKGHNLNRHTKKPSSSLTTPECATNYHLTNKSSNKRCVVELWS